MFVGDTHIDDRTPMSRLDNYLEASLDELQEIMDITKDLSCDALVHLGDVFHRIDPSGACRNGVLSILQHDKNGNPWPFRKITLIGNHDIDHNPHYLYRSALGTLLKAGAIENMDFCPELKIGLANFNPNIDQHIKDGLMESREAVIWTAHATILTQESPYLPSQVLFKDIRVNEACRMVISGHVHFPLFDSRHDGITFINPGSVCRNSIAKENLNRMPNILLVDYNLDGTDIKYQYVDIKCSKPADQIFKIEEMQAKKDGITDTKKYMKQISKMTIGLHGEDKYDMIRKSGLVKQIPEAVVAVVIETLKSVNKKRRVAGD